MRNILLAFQNLMNLKQVRTGHANLVGYKLQPNPSLNREPVKTAFFGEPEPNLNRLNLRSWT